MVVVVVCVCVCVWGVTMTTHLFTLVLAEGNAAHDLLVDEVGVDVVQVGRVPGREVLASEEEPPEGAALAHAHLLGVLLAFRDGVHHTMHPVTQTRDLTLKQTQNVTCVQTDTKCRLR